MLTNQKLLRIGLCGTVMAAVCWLTPLLVVTLSAVGLPVMRVWVDNVAAPALPIFMGLTMYALARMDRLKIVSCGCCYVPLPEELRIPPADKKRSD
jgi:mercuric ion transport protein